MVNFLVGVSIGMDWVWGGVIGFFLIFFISFFMGIGGMFLVSFVVLNSCLRVFWCCFVVCFGISWGLERDVC